MMDFTLVYQGPLQTIPSTRVSQKHEIRRAFHPQLTQLVSLPAWKQHMEQLSFIGPDYGDLCLQHQVADYKFLSLISEHIGLFAELDVRLLRPNVPGSIIQRNGDIDNQLRILFDGLRRPSNTSEVPPGASPTLDERPFFLCVLDDDIAIRHVSTRSEQLLYEQGRGDVIAVVRVAVQVAHRHWMNAHIAG